MANRISALGCPKCGYAYSKAVNGRTGSGSAERSYRRSRECLQCHALFITYEVQAADYALLMELKRWVAKQAHD